VSLYSCPVNGNDKIDDIIPHGCSKKKQQNVAHSAYRFQHLWLSGIIPAVHYAVVNAFGIEVGKTVCHQEETASNR